MTATRSKSYTHWVEVERRMRETGLLGEARTAELSNGQRGKAERKRNTTTNIE